MVIGTVSIKKMTLIGALALGAFLLSASAVRAQEAVIVVSSPAKEVVTNTLKNSLSLEANLGALKNLESLIMKEFNLDSLARNQAQKLQQQLVSDTIKMLGGQLLGQNGQVPFIQNFGEHYQAVVDQAAGGIIFGDEIADQCSERKTYETRAVAYNWYLDQMRGSGPTTQNQCQVGQTGQRAIDRILMIYDSCSEDGLCAGLEAQNQVARAAADAIDISNRENVNGYYAKKACRTNEAGGQDCDIVTPSSLISDSVSYNVGELPAQLLLNVDEFNEIVSSFMSNLTNQAISGITGVLGLSGHSDYSSNVFGPDGNLSYADALAQDDISQYQHQPNNPIKEAIKNENKYRELQNRILSEIGELEEKLEENEDEFSGCFNLDLSDELVEAKEAAIDNLEISSTTMAILTLLDTQYDAATDPAVRNAVITSFTEYESQGYFRTAVENQDLELSYINYELAEIIDIFKYETAVERYQCGGSFDYDGILNDSTGGAPGGND